MKKIIKALIVVMMLTMVVMAFTGCLDQIIPKEDPCKGGHKMEAFAEEPATCTTAGKSAGVVCTVCGYEERTRFEIPAKGHKMADATCTDPSTCTVCGHTEGEALGHSLVLTNGKLSTCTEVGYTAHHACERCDYTEGKEEVAMIPHSYTVDVEGKAPTCLPGYEAYKACEVCGAADPDTFVEIPALGDEGHEFNEDELFVAVEPTCTEQGLMGGYCIHCEKGFYVDYIPTLAHDMVDGKCSVCGHEHAFADATCTTPKTCECGATEGEVAPHKYVYGICSVCEAKDPTYVDYYLVGYINGKDYGCEADHANLGEYKFVDGKLTVTFEQDSYIFVKTGNLAGASVKWYLFQSYTTGKEGTLYENKSEKMFIPGKVEVVFTLTVNEDGSLTLVADYHTHSFAPATCTSPAKCECGATEGEALDHADANGDFKCDGCSTKMLPADGTTLTIPQALAIAKMQSHNTYTSQKYYITGIVTNVYNTQYGNFYIKDAEGNQICIYGLYSADGKTRYDAMSYKPVEGDEVTVYTVLGAYNTTYQGKNAWLDEVVAHKHNYKAVVTEPTCTKGGYTTHTCTICNGFYVDSETEATGHTTDNGVCEGCGQTIGGESPVFETFKADFNTIASTNSSYVKSTTTSGWVATNCAVMGGGTTDANPKFKVFGDAATRAFTLNGKTSAKGSLVSPTLTGGISYLTFNFTNCFSESNGVDITITIKQNGTVVATKKLDQNSVTKLTAYTFEWDLAGEGVAVSGDFTIEITNNSPTKSTSNKDRVSIWNLEWKNNPAA